MTFYWWSHWFWITILCNNFLSLIVIVFTYPSQKVILLDYMQNIKFYDKSTRGKLYQATMATVIMPKSTNDYSNNLPNTTTKSTDLFIHNTLYVNDNGNVDKDTRKELCCEKDDQHNHYNGSGNEEKLTHENLKNSTHLILKYNINETDKEVKRSAEQHDITNNNNDSKYNNDNDHTNHTNVIDDDEDVKEIVNKAILEKYNYPYIDINSMNFTNKTSTPIIVDNYNAENVNITQQATSLRQEKLPNTLTVAQNIINTTENFTITEMPFTLENVKKEINLRPTEFEQRSRKSKGLAAEYRHIPRFINYTTDAKSLLTRSASVKPNNYDNDDSNVSSEALTVQHAYFLDVGSVSAICIAIFGICSVIGVLSIILYRRRYLNKPQTLSEPDSSVYIDDNTMRVSDNSDEMYSLDNDSFLNSLEAMTIQNYWTDTVKHTKL